jgi:hypothetical protein
MLTEDEYEKDLFFVVCVYHCFSDGAFNQCNFQLRASAGRSSSASLQNSDPSVRRNNNFHREWK